MNHNDWSTSPMRAPFQVLVVPYRRAFDALEFLILQRADSHKWQWVAGGGEDDETPVQAAQRELVEELSATSAVRPLATISPVPVVNITGELTWGYEHLIVMEHAFCVNLDGQEFTLSSEHISARWVGLEKAGSMLEFDSNRTAAWEVKTLSEGGLLA
ncbi:NUDIX pyrophosphatase [Promicromonospora sp. NPDC057488]|uniref:NUDIX hydrolase n=1 Tax=Promicromonospora sp. NPDC057488 TaxID=3346147 RepID=UPI00366F8BFE